MVFNGTDWTVVGSNAVGALAVIGAIVAYVKKRFPKATQAVEQMVAKKVPHAVVVGVEDAIKFVEHLAQSPFFAGKVAVGELQVKHVLDELTQTKAVSEAKTILMQLGKAYSVLSVEQQIKAQSVLKLGLLKLGINMTDAEIQAVFQAVDASGQALSADKTFATLFEQPQA